MSSGITIMASVYDGRQRHHLDERVFEALDPENRSHGTFATYREAAAALPSIEKQNNDQSI